MTSRERIRTVVWREPVDRIGLYEMVFWPETIERWEKEGLPEGMDPNDYLGTDTLARMWIDNTLRFETKVLQESEKFIIETDALGVTKKSWKNTSHPPYELDYAVKTIEDWRKHKHRLTVVPDRYTSENRSIYQKGSASGAFRFVQVWEPVWFVIHLIGYERVLMATVEAPEFIREVMADYMDFLIPLLSLGESEGLVIDGLWVNADLCYKNGIFFSPKYYQEEVTPFDRIFADFCKQRDIPLFLHCCGRVTELIPLLIEVGYDCLHPLEARAGNDIREIKKTYGDKMAFIGNIAAETLSSTKEVIEEEIRAKVPMAMQGGGYIFGSDHSIPPSVSLENYRFAVELAREIGRY